MSKIYEIPLTDKQKEELSEVYESIYLKKPHHKLLDENLIKAIQTHKPEYKLANEVEEKDVEEKEIEVNSNESDEELKSEIEKYISNYGAKPKKSLDLNAIKLANESYNEARQKTPQGSKKKKKKVNVRKDLVRVKNDKGVVIHVNQFTFNNYLSKNGWKIVTEKPTELK